ncbi:hypothetical protein ACTA71_010696 [Dictyostelium dimigraforme]
MVFKTILLLFLLSLCTVKGSENVAPIKIETVDVSFCVVPNGTYNVDLNGTYFKFLDSTLVKAYLVPDEVNGYLYVNQAGRNANFHLDEFIYNSLFGVNSYEYATNSTMACAATLATYMCSYTFVGSTPPCNMLCDPAFQCANNFTYSNTLIPPASVEECKTKGINQNCSAINMKGLMGNWTHKDYEIISQYEKYPGGIVRGSLLGFGVLIGLLLIVGSLGIIMKFQNK